MLRVSVVVITHNRAHELEACLRHIQQQTYTAHEIIVLDNASTDGTLAMLANNFPDCRAISLPDNLGVMRARNRGYEEASGDICVTVDDDALLEPPHALARVAAAFERDPLLCCISFEVRDGSGKLVKHFIPRRDRKIITDDSPGAFFVGTGHAMHRERFLALGGFWEGLSTYFGEEPELSYRILEAGYHILHTPHIAVRHFESKAARPNGRRIYFGTRNTPWIAIKNLPWYAVASLTFLSWCYYATQALRCGAIGSFVCGMRDSVRGAPAVLRERRPVSKSTIALLKRYSGVYWY